jgi:signal transduction histidine kinase
MLLTNEDPVHILLIDPKREIEQLLHTHLIGEQTSPHQLTHLPPKTAKEEFERAIRVADVLIFGDRTTARSVVRLSAGVRKLGLTLPVFVVSRESEGGVSPHYKKAGVDEVININELHTPLISWTLTSTMKHAEVRRKAKEFDDIQNEIMTISESLAFITHEINNPLSVMKLALYHLQSYQTDEERRATLMKIIGDNIDKVQEQMSELRSLRSRLGEKSPEQPVAEPQPVRSKIKAR